MISGTKVYSSLPNFTKQSRVHWLTEWKNQFKNQNESNKETTQQYTSHKK